MEKFTHSTPLANGVVEKMGEELGENHKEQH
jgi:hypothetical protein